MLFSAWWGGFFRAFGFGVGFWLVSPMGVPPCHGQPPPPLETTLDGAGEFLFSDEGLSPFLVSCASCHQPENAFQDSLERALSGRIVQTRNTPSVLNVERYETFFWDGRAGSLEDQVEGPLFSRLEMGSSPEFVADYVASSEYLQKCMGTNSIPDPVEFVKQALVSYMRSLSASYVPAHQVADTVADPELSGLQEKGRDLFHGRAKCASCHEGANLTDGGYHDIGLVRRKIVLQDTYIAKKRISSLIHDRGRGNVSFKQDDEHRFRTPSLYDVSRTAPYMHDGRFHSLEEVFDFYLRNKELQKKHDMELTAKDRKSILAFLESLRLEPVERSGKKETEAD